MQNTNLNKVCKTCTHYYIEHNAEWCDNPRFKGAADVWEDFYCADWKYNNGVVRDKDKGLT